MKYTQGVGCSNKQTMNAAITAIMVCLFCWLFFSNTGSATTEFVVTDTLVVSDGSDGSAASLSFYTSASHFEHHKQSADWQFERIDESTFVPMVADAYLLAEPILIDWFLIKPSSRLRLAGWKDASLQFKIKNAFI